MTSRSVDLRVWEENHAMVRAMQGEGNSRTLAVTFLDSDGGPVDLTGCTPRMFLAGSDPPLFTDGTAEKAENGTAEFVLTPEMTAESGIFPCQFLLAGPDFPPLKADGLALYVAASHLEPAEEATGEYSALVRALNRADAAAAKVDAALSGGLDPAVDARIAARTGVAGGVMGYDDAHAHLGDGDIHVTAAQKAAWTEKAEKSTTVNGHALTGNVTVTKDDVGLGRADNTADAEKRVADTASIAGALTLADAEPSAPLAEGKLWGVYAAADDPGGSPGGGSHG